MSQQYLFQCNIAQALNIIGDKWSLLILHGIMSGHQTYKEIYNSLEGQIASNLLSSRLKALEADGLISSDLYQKHPPRYRYTLTQAGEDLNIVFNSKDIKFFFSLKQLEYEVGFKFSTEISS